MKRITAFLTIIIFLSGCAYGTIINGSKQEVIFNSKPEGAEVSVNGQKIGKTPFTWELPRKTERL